MTSSIFIEWLHRFDHYIRSTRNRKVILVIENASCHGTVEDIPILPKVEVAFLPKCSTSKTLPLDAGIIACIKWRYRKKQIMRALDLIDENEDDATNLYKVDVLTSIYWISSV